MPRTLDSSPNAIGQRILQLLGERDLSLRQLSRGSKVPYRTLQHWIGQTYQPRIPADRRSRIEAFLGGAIIPEAEPPVGKTGEREEEMVMEGKGDYARHRLGEVRVQRIDFRQHALHASGRARHGLARALEYLSASPPNIRDAIASLEMADSQMALAQRVLLGKIETDDNGDPV